VPWKPDLIKSPFSGPCFSLALAGIRRRVVQILAFEKDDLHPGGGPPAGVEFVAPLEILHGVPHLVEPVDLPGGRISCEDPRPHAAWSMCTACLCLCIPLSRATPLGRLRYQTSEFPTELPTHISHCWRAEGDCVNGFKDDLTENGSSSGQNPAVTGLCVSS